MILARAREVGPKDVAIPYSDIRGETDKAILFRFCISEDESWNVWIPLSQISVVNREKKEVTMSKWIAQNKELL